MEKCKRMKRQLCMSKSWIYSWLWKSPWIRQQFYRSESFAMNTDTLTSGSTVKNHISLKMVFGYNVTRRTSFRSWFLVCHRVLPPTFLLQHQWHLQDRDWSSYIFLKIVYFTNHNCVKRQWDQSSGRPEWDRFPSSICGKWTCWKERTGRPVYQANQKSKIK